MKLHVSVTDAVSVVDMGLDVSRGYSGKRAKFQKSSDNPENRGYMLVMMFVMVILNFELKNRLEGHLLAQKRPEKPILPL